jgi:putative transcriptional regulator
MKKRLQFESIKAGLLEAVAISQGKAKGARVSVRSVESIAEIRQKLNLPNAEFAKVFGVSQKTIESWEKGTKKPSGAAKTLLKIAEKNPRAVLDSLHSL